MGWDGVGWDGRLRLKEGQNCFPIAMIYNAAR